MERLEVTMPSGEAIVDTGATQDLIRALSHRWAAAGLKAVKIDVPCGCRPREEARPLSNRLCWCRGCSGVLQMLVLTVDIPPTAVLSTGFMDFYGHDYRLVRQGDPLHQGFIPAQ